GKIRGPDENELDALRDALEYNFELVDDGPNASQIASINPEEAKDRKIRVDLLALYYLPHSLRSSLIKDQVSRFSELEHQSLVQKIASGTRNMTFGRFAKLRLLSLLILISTLSQACSGAVSQLSSTFLNVGGLVLNE